MMSEPHEKMALLEEKMIVIFFGSKWSQWLFFRKCALPLCWWPRIVATAKKADKSTVWRVPTNFDEEAKLEQLSTDDRKLIKYNKQRAARTEVAGRRKVMKSATTKMKQIDFGFPKTGQNDAEGA